LYASGVTYGIFVSVSSENRFSNCRFDSCTNGVRCDTAPYNHFTNTLTENCDYGFYIAAAGSCRFVECDTLNSGTSGIHEHASTTIYTNGCFFDSKAISSTEKTITYV